MRVPLLCLALALPVWAEPTIRWIDHTGGARTARVQRTLAGTKGCVVVERADGKELRVPYLSLLEWIREDESVSEQRMLLAARTRVRAGVELDKAKDPLDQLASSGTKPWIRHYATAFRLLLALKQSEKAWPDRYAEFLERHPRSRFLAEILVERAHRLGEAEKEALPGIQCFRKAFLDADRSGGPRRQQFRSLSELAVQNQRNPMGETRKLRLQIWAWIGQDYPKPDVVFSACSLSAETDFERTALAVSWRNAHRYGHDLKGFRKPIQALLLASALLLPGSRAAIEFELGMLAAAEKRADDARKHLQAARKLDADRAARYRIDYELARLKR